MVAVSGESPLDLLALLGTLESKSALSDDRLEAYNTLTIHLIEGELSIFEQDIVQQGSRLLRVAKQDVTHFGELPDILIQKALHVISYCLNDQEIVRYASAVELSSLVRLLCDVAVSSADKTVCTRSLWCLSRQKISVDIIEGELQCILTALNKAVTKWKGQSVIVDHEALAVIIRLCEQCGKQMEAECTKWGRLVLSQLVSQAQKVRERAFSCLKEQTAFFSSHADFAHLASSDLKMIGQGLKKLFEGGQEAYTVKVWEVLMQIFKQELTRTSVLNEMLQIIQPAFKSDSQEVRGMAFHSWRILIDVFAENPSWLGDPKRVKLVMQVFTLCSTTAEATTIEKVGTLWHYICCLGARSWSNFDLVIKPLLLVCTGNVPLRTANVHPVTAAPTPPKLVAKAGSIHSPQSPRLPAGSAVSVGAMSPAHRQPTPRLQELGMEILAQLLADDTTPAPPSTIETFKPDARWTPIAFVKNANTLMLVMFELIRSLNTRISEPLLIHVWRSMLAHLSNALESSSRSDCREHLSFFLLQFQSLVLNQIIPHKLLLKLFQLVCSLPQKVLSSTAFNVCSGEVVKGCPAQFLCEVLLTPELLRECTNNESFITLLSVLLQCGTNHPSRVLQFCQFVSELLDRNAEFLPGPEVLWRLWSIVAHTVQEHISKTNEVNQGDSLEYNFDCLYAILLIPVTHQLGSRVNQSVLKALMKTWSELYRTFARLSALVPNAETNIIVEYMSSRILETYTSKDHLHDAALLDYLMNVCQVIVDTVDFSSLAPKQTFGLGLSPSPSKWTRRRQKPMGNIHSFVCLVATLMEAVCASAINPSEELPFTNQHKTGEETAHLIITANTSLEVMTVLVTRVSTSSVVRHMLETIASPLANYMKVANKKSSLKLHTPAFLQKLEKLWADVCTMIQSRYSGPYDSDLLNHLSPLLQATFLHSRRQIKNQTVLLWNATFSRSAPLTYPDELQPVLSKVKEKIQILLPGWTNIDVTVIDETPLSQISQLDSQAPEPVLPGMPSPVRLRGSLLQKDLSPKPSHLSPAKSVVPSSLSGGLFGGRARKNLTVDLMPDEDFVVINTKPKKRRILTEHQKEVMKEKRVFPVMYNNLDISQDVSLMSQLSSSDTQQESVLVTSKDDNAVIVINSSQSQELEQKTAEEVQEQDVPDVKQKRIHPSVRRSLRRKTVHFEDKSQENKSQAETEPCSSAQKQSAEQNKSLLQEEIGEENMCEGNIQKFGKCGKTTSLPYPEPNQLAMFGEKLIETLSSKESSITTKSSLSESSSGEQMVIQEADPFFRPFKSLSQSPPVSRRRYSQKLEEEISAGCSARKTRSQEVDWSLKLIAKGSGTKPANLPICTSLEKWLKKAETSKPDVSLSSSLLSAQCSEGNKSDESSMHSARTPPQGIPQTFVEETQSLEEQSCKPLTTDLSIQETPPKKIILKQTSTSSRESVLDANKTHLLPDETNRFMATTDSSEESAALKQLVPQDKEMSNVAVLQEQRTATELAAGAEDACRSDTIEIIPSGKELHTLCEPSLSQGFSPENISSQISEELTSNSKLNQKGTNKQKRAIYNRETLFGFSELLQEDTSLQDEEVTSLEASNMQLGEQKHKLRNAADDTECDPGLVAAQNLSLPAELCHSQALTVSTATADSDGSQNMESQSTSQLESVEHDLQKTNLQGSAGHPLNKRKRRTPTKVESAQKVRRNPKRTERKSICSCCKDGNGQHHKTPSKELRGKGQKLAAKQVASLDLVVTPDPGTEELKGEQGSKKDITDREAFLKNTHTWHEVAENENIKAAEIGTKVDLSPQEVGEKTPDLKASASRTPQRKSTTKRKMEEARRRSVSKSLLGSPRNTTDTDSESEDLPLSQIALSSKAHSYSSGMAGLVDTSKLTEVGIPALVAPPEETKKDQQRKGHATRLTLMRLAKSRLPKTRGTSTKLQFRQRKSIQNVFQGEVSVLQPFCKTEDLKKKNISDMDRGGISAETKITHLSVSKDPEDVITCSASPVKEKISSARPVILKKKMFSEKVKRRLKKDAFRRSSLSPVSVRLRSSSNKRRTRSKSGTGSSSFVLQSPKRLFRKQKKTQLELESSDEVKGEKMDLEDRKELLLMDMQQQVAPERSEVHPNNDADFTLSVQTAESCACGSVSLSKVSESCINQEMNVEGKELVTDKQLLNFSDNQKDDNDHRTEEEMDADKNKETENKIDKNQTEDPGVLQLDIEATAEKIESVAEKSVLDEPNGAKLGSINDDGFLHHRITINKVSFLNSQDVADNEMPIKKNTEEDSNEEHGLHHSVSEVKDYVCNQSIDLAQELNNECLNKLCSNAVLEKEENCFFPVSSTSSAKEHCQVKSIEVSDAIVNTIYDGYCPERESVASSGMPYISLGKNDNSKDGHGSCDSEKGLRENISNETGHNSQDIFPSMQSVEGEMLVCSGEQNLEHCDSSVSDKDSPNEHLGCVQESSADPWVKPAPSRGLTPEEDFTFSLKVTDTEIPSETSQQLQKVTHEEESSVAGEPVSCHEVGSPVSRAEDQGNSSPASNTSDQNSCIPVIKTADQDSVTLVIKTTDQDNCSPVTNTINQEYCSPVIMTSDPGNAVPASTTTDQDNVSPASNAADQDNVGPVKQTVDQDNGTAGTNIADQNQNSDNKQTNDLNVSVEERQMCVEKELCVESQFTSTNSFVGKTLISLETDSSEIDVTESVTGEDTTLQVTPNSTKDLDSQGTMDVAKNVTDSPLDFGMLHQKTVSSDSKVKRLRAIRLHAKTLARRSLLQREQVCHGSSPEKSANCSQEDGDRRGLANHLMDTEAASPSASPSGILKKRSQVRLSQDGSQQDCSLPPGKKRRVSFADPVVSGESPSHQATLMHTVWRWDPSLSTARSAANFTSYLSLQPAHSSKEHSQHKLTRLRRKRSCSPESSQMSNKTSQNSYCSTQDSQLNSKDPIFPALVDCSKSAEIILPQLTSSVWHRGLSQLMKSRGVHTIGDLARLTEVDIQLMPVKTPKVDVVRGALQRYYANHSKRLSSALVEGSSSDQESVKTKSSVVGAWEKLPEVENEELPSADEALKELFSDKADDEDLNSSIEGPDDLEVDSWPAAESPQIQPHLEPPTLTPEPPLEPPTSICDLKKTPSLKKLSSLIKSCSSEDINQLTNSELFEFHKQLSNLTSIVFDTIKSRCSLSDS